MRPNPFDFKTVVLAKHVVLTHFPIALFITAVFFYLIAFGPGAARSRARFATTWLLLRWRHSDYCPGNHWLAAATGRPET
jgi:hypothetical protein